jgi:hypothetical protein
MIQVLRTYIDTIQPPRGWLIDIVRCACIFHFQKDLIDRAENGNARD